MMQYIFYVDNLHIFVVQINLKKGKFVLILVILYLVQKVEPWNKFCSVVCSGQNCANTSYAACTNSQCMAPWSWNTTTSVCQVLTTSGWALVDISNDVGGTISANVGSTATCGPYTGGSQWQYTFYGNLTGPAIITFTDSMGPQVPHYQIRLICWIILMDNWQGSDQIRVTLDGNQTQTMNRNNKVTNQKTCGNNGDDEDYVRFDRTYTHNATAPYSFTITTNNSNSKWGVKQCVVLVRICHLACTACFGAAVTQCYACQQNTPMWLSGTTCNQTCLTGYGQTSDMMTCVFCDLKCTKCYQLSYNCTACKTSGTYASFLLASNYSCETICPVGMYANYTDRNCYFCDPSCVSCRTTPTYCFQCNTTLGYAWNGYTCYNPCPIGTFLSNSNTNCTNCSLFCIQCVNTSTICTACTLTGIYTAYLLGTDCLRACPNKYYADTANGTLNTCQPCDISCLICTGNPSPCSACNPTWWLNNDTCGSTCPSGYFPDNTTWSCLLCDIWCVQLTMKMYFPDATNNMIYVDMTFTQDLDFTTFPYETYQTFNIDSDLYTIDMFKFTYQILNSRTYRIIMQPKGYIFLYNATIYCTVMDLPLVVHDSSNGRPFKTINYGIQKQLLWFVIKAPDMTQGQIKIINGLADMSDSLSQITTQPYIQQLKKSGLFAFLFSGAQITSCSVLVNNIPSQNLYQGVRFWAIFVFFDVPPWEKNSNKTKYVVVPPITDVINNSRLLQQRMLFDIYSIQWRFTRTGHTSFFIFDTYPVLALILICWILVLIGYCLNKKKPLLFKRHMGKFFTLIHKVHEISIMYIVLSTIMQWLYFDQNHLERWLSLGFCILFNIYFMIYELYIYYDMLKYPVADIGNQKYEYYAIRYGSLLKTIRYVQYDLKESWSPKQWFRPYNYHILAFYKKLMMIASLPLFYHTIHAQAGVLILLQALQIARFCYVWPFYRKWRNIYRLILQCALQMFFICVLIQGYLVRQIMQNNESTIMYSIQMFYRFGWVAFGMVFLFNCGFIVLYLYDLYRGCKMSNQQMMDQARRIYYYQKLKSYEESNQDVPLALVNKWVKKGNLNQRNYDVLPDVNIRVEYFRIAKLSNGNFQVQLKRLVDLFMNIQFNYTNENNVSSGHKINKRFNLTRELSKDFYYLISTLFRKYETYNVTHMTIKTFQRVQQSLCKPGDRVQLTRDKMTQKIVLELHSGEKKTQTFDKPLDGFPVPLQDLAMIS